jgi:antagonist of KipI
MTVVVLRPGPFSTVQDLGRTACGSLGVPRGGSMDEPALRLANRLVGNSDDRAAIEITLAGPELRFEEDTWIALTGSRFEATVGGRPVPWGETFVVRARDTLSIGRTLEGTRGIIAVAGGIDLPVVLGSRATCLAGAFGGLDGRALKAGDRLRFASPGRGRVHRRLRSATWPAYSTDCELRVIAGPEADRFPDIARHDFFSANYAVSSRSDRTGLRLEGARVEHCGSAEVLPEGMVAGAVQVPADGLPIILGADCPVTGGYVKIATVITADVWRVAQAKPGDRVRFVEVRVEEARALYRRQEELLRSAVEDLDR